jgi:uncharacterized repeat protein (TIGR01451 family)
VRDFTRQGTKINNTATIQYISGATSLTVNSNLDSAECALLASITLSPPSQSQNGNPGDQKTYVLTLTNNGNETEEIKLSASSTMGWKWLVWVDYSGTKNREDDDNNNDRYKTITLPMGSSIQLKVTITIPVGSPDRTIDSTTITGKSSLLDNLTTSAVVATTVMAPVFTLTKSVSPIGSQPPGTELLYTVALGNSGTGLATKVKVTDVMPQFTTYKPNSIRTGPDLAGLVPRTDSPDGDNAMYDPVANAVVIGGPTQLLPPGNNFVFQFSVVIN